MAPAGGDDEPAGNREDRRGENAGDVERGGGEDGDEERAKAKCQDVHAEGLSDRSFDGVHDSARFALCIEFAQAPLDRLSKPGEQLLSIVLEFTVSMGRQGTGSTETRRVSIELGEDAAP